MRFLNHSPLIVEIALWTMLAVALVYVQLLRSTGWRYVTYHRHRILLGLYGICAILLAYALFETVVAPPDYSGRAVAKLKAFSFLIGFVGFLCIVGGFISTKNDVELAVEMEGRDSSISAAQRVANAARKHTAVNSNDE
jgi:hypothetical protein